MRFAFVFAKRFVKSMDDHIKTELSLASLTATRPRIELNQVDQFRREADIADCGRGRGRERCAHPKRFKSAITR